MVVYSNDCKVMQIERDTGNESDMYDHNKQNSYIILLKFVQLIYMILQASCNEFIKMLGIIIKSGIFY